MVFINIDAKVGMIFRFLKHSWRDIPLYLLALYLVKRICEDLLPFLKEHVVSLKTWQEYTIT